MSTDAEPNPVAGHSTSSTTIVNGASARQKTSPSLDSHASPSGAFSRLIDAVRECIQYEDAYGDIEGTQKLLTQKDSELKLAKEELKKERSSHNHLITRQAEELAKWAAEKKVLEKDKEKLKKTLEEERGRMNETLKAERKKRDELLRENEQLKSNLEERNGNIVQLEEERKKDEAVTSRLEMDLFRMKNAKSELDSELTVCQEQLREWNTYTAVLSEVDVGDFSNKMYNLWTRIQKFAEKYFLVDVPEDLFTDPVKWDNLVKPLYIIEGVPPLPPRNSIAAKHMRLVAFLAFLADRIDYHIFAPTYTGNGDDAIRELLLQHTNTDIKREAACRALILSAYTKDHQKQAAETLASKVTNEASAFFGCFLSPSEIDSFGTDLKKHIREAMTLWWFAQRSVQKIEASVEDGEGREWDSLNIFEGEGEKATSDQFQIALFPRVFMTQDGRWQCVFPGVALSEWQTEAADIEWQEHKAAVKSAKRSMSIRGPGSSGRRMSRVDGNGSALGSPTSPTSTSFLERRKTGPGRGDG